MDCAIEKTLLKPTTVDHCLSCCLTGDDHLNLVVARGSLLQVYRLVRSRVVRHSSRNADGADAQRGEDSTAELRLVVETQVFGDISSLCAHRPQHGGRDSLLVSIPDAKVSVMRFDDDSHQLVVSSMHFWERNPHVRGTRATAPLPPELRIDPQQRCAAMVAYGHTLCILPFRARINVEDGELEEFRPLAPSFPIDLDALQLHYVHDFAFLHGYSAPTIAILCEPRPTWGGRDAFARSTCQVVVLLIDLAQRSTVVIWRVERLSYQHERIVPVASPLGGCVLLSPNMATYLNQDNRFAVGFNELASVSTTHEIPLETSKAVIALDAAVYTWISDTRLLLSLKNGDLWIFHLSHEGARVTTIHAVKAGASVLTSCLTRLGKQYLFFGSRLGNPLLVHFREKSANDMEEEQERTKRQMVAEAEALAQQREEELEEAMAAAAVAAMQAAQKKANGEDMETDNVEEPPTKRLKADETVEATAQTNVDTTEQREGDEEEKEGADVVAAAAADDNALTEKKGDTDNTSKVDEEDDDYEDLYGSVNDEMTAGDANAAEFEQDVQRSSSAVPVNRSSSLPLDEADDDLAALYADSEAMGAHNVFIGYNLVIVDSLVNVGPIADFAVGEIPDELDDDEEADYQALTETERLQQLGMSTGTDWYDGEVGRRRRKRDALARPGGWHRGVPIHEDVRKEVNDEGGGGANDADANETAENVKRSVERSAELVCCSGHGKNGSLSILQGRIRPDVITESSLPGAIAIFSLFDPPPENADAAAAAATKVVKATPTSAAPPAKSETSPAAERMKVDAMEMDDEDADLYGDDDATAATATSGGADAGASAATAMEVEAGDGATNDDEVDVTEEEEEDDDDGDDQRQQHAYLVISEATKTRVLRSAGRLTEISNRVDFHLGPTLHCCNFFGRRKIVQVYSEGVKLLHGVQSVQDIVIVDDARVNPHAATIARCTVADPYLFVQLVDGSAILFSGREDVEMLHVKRVDALLRNKK